MIRRIKKAVCNNRGDVSYVSVAVGVIFTALLMCVVLTYAKCTTIANMTEENTQLVLDSFVMKNSVEIFKSIKQGHDYTANYDEAYYQNYLADEVDFDDKDGKLCHMDDDGAVVYKMSVPSVEFITSNALKLKANYNLEMPVEMGFFTFWISVPMEVVSSLTLIE